MEQKKALLVGINYKNTDSELYGCINDVLNMKNFLIKNGGYKEENITLLSDDSIIKPTKINIIDQLYKLITSGKEKLFFHYSGHGSRIKDTSNDEEDGQDECLVPLHYDKDGFIIDDEIYGLMKLLQPNQSMICFMDCCHSGTIMDLPYELSETLVTKTLSFKKNKNKILRGQCIMISGCLDKQTSADAYLDNKNQGAFTNAFLSTYEENMDYQKCIVNIRSYLKNNNFTQYPTMSTGIKISLKNKFIF